MNSAEPFCEEIGENRPKRLFSRRLLRHLISECQLSPGSRVLEIGCGTGELSRFLHRLSFDVVALDSSPEAISTATAASPEIDFHLWQETTVLPETEHGYDLVLANDLNIFRNSLSSANSFQFMAEISSCVRPGGSLMILSRLDPTWMDQPGGHLKSCYQRLFSCFPGKCRTKTLNDPITDLRTWSWILGRSPRSGYLAASLRVSPEPFSRKQWQQQALRETFRSQDSCCPWARRQGVIEIEHRRAA